MKIRLTIAACAWLVACGGGDGVPDMTSTPAPTGDAGAGGGAAPRASAVATLAGGAEAGTADGAGDAARFNNPVNVAVGPDGRVYVADYDNGVLRVVTRDGAVSTLTRQAGFAKPYGMAFASDGTLYVETDTDEMGERGNQVGCIWRVGADGRAAIVARHVGRPRGLAALPDGRIAYADPAHHVVGVFNPSTRQMAVLAGAADQAGYADGDGAAARFNGPASVVVSGDRLLVADSDNNRVRAVTLAGRVTTYAGSGSAGVDDGDRASARFHHPQALAVDRGGFLFVADVEAGRLRLVTPAGRVSTLAGSGGAGFRDGAPLEATFTGMEGIALSADGMSLYVADGTRGNEGGHHRVRRVALAR